MLINATHAEENRVAIVDDGILAELDIEITGQEQTKGNIYKGTVSRVEPGLQAAFIDFGSERSGFLQLGEIHPGLYPPKEERGRERPRINDLLRRGQELLVQVVKEERGTKGAALTTYLSLPGRYMVLMPGTGTKGISRKITDEAERKKLKAAFAELEIPSDIGCIIRTAGIGKEPQELKRDFDYLLRLYRNITNLSDKTKAPALVYRESNLVIRSIRDYFTPEIDEVLVDDPKVFQEARDFFQQVMPEYARLVKLHQERRPIFSRYQIEEQIEDIVQNRVELPSGGSLVIDSTEALVAIDVNSGKMAGEQGVESTAYKTNLEAVREVARQLRLRDLGGLIVIDLIDMRGKDHIREVERTLKDALKHDKARVTVGRISQFGLLEMSRQRIKSALAMRAYSICPHCGGSGRLLSVEARAVALLRRIQASVAKGQVGRVEAHVAREVATYLLNNKRRELAELEQRMNVIIHVRGRASFTTHQTEIELIRREVLEAEAARAEAAQDESPVTAEVSHWGELEQPETPETAEATEGQSNGEEGRKRKRRRRKKSSGAAHAPETAEAEAEHAAAETAAPSPGDAETAEKPAAEEGRKRKRRRRKKGGGAAHAADAEQTAAAEATPAPAVHAPEPVAAAEPTAATAPAETAEAPTEKPKRTRRPRAAKKPAAPAAPTAEVAAPAPAEAAPPEAAEAAVPTEKPKRTRKPRTAKKPAAATPEAAEAATPAPAEAATPAPAEKPKPARKPRAPRKAKAAEQPAEPAEQPAAEQAKETTKEQAEGKAEEKPKRPRRPRKKAETTNEPTE